MRRRRFLAAVAAAPATAAAAAPGGARKPPIVDAHVHCFAGAADAKFPYHARAPYRPEAAATPEHLLRCMDGAGVGSAIIVHPEPYQDDHRYLEHCLAVGRGRLKGTCLFFADRPGWERAMEALVKRSQGGIVTARIHAYAPERLPPFGKPELRALWKKAADLGLAVQLHFEPRYAPGFEPLLEEFSRTPVIIDHLGRPLQGTPDEHEIVLRWAKRPNTYLKLSAVPQQTDYPHRDVAAIIKRLAAAYGARRMLYGGGFGTAGVTPESYRAARERLRGFVAHLPAADQDEILGGTAARLFGFPG